MSSCHRIARSGRALAFLAIASAIAGCAANAGESSAERGLPLTSATVATACQWPSVVDLSCSGVLVNPRLVVTAAHCLSAAEPAVHQIALGESASSPARTVAVTECKGHELFDNVTSEFDIGACVLAEPVTDVPLIPILAPCESAVLAVGTPVTLVGFGTTGADAGDTLGLKRIVQTTIAGSLSPNTLRAGTNTATTCHGDSGSPAFVQVPDGSYRVFGILSRSDGFECASPGVYVKLATFVPWLERTFGFDVSPCLDDDGVWQKSADCVSFPSAPDHSDSTWDDGCAMTARVPAADSCQLPDAGLTDPSTSDAGGAPPVLDSGTGPVVSEPDAAEAGAPPKTDGSLEPKRQEVAASNGCAIALSQRMPPVSCLSILETALLVVIGRWRRRRKAPR